MRIRGGFIAFATIIQAILFVTHLFIYETWMFALPWSETSSAAGLKVTVGVLSISFLSATLLAFRFSNPTVVPLYLIVPVRLVVVVVRFVACLGARRRCGLHS